MLLNETYISRRIFGADNFFIEISLNNKKNPLQLVSNNVEISVRGEINVANRTRERVHFKFDRWK